MSALERLRLLTAQMHLESTGDPSLSPDLPRQKEALAVSTAALPNGKRIRLLKTLLSSYCENNCQYCPFQSQLDVPRTAFSPDAFARLFMQLYSAGFVEGIFLSSGVFNGAISTQDLLLDTATILRRTYQYPGYLHLKIMPGADRSQIEAAMHLADRLSVNLEAPHPQALAKIAPGKRFQDELISPLHWMEEMRQNQSAHKAWNGRWPSSTTQYVVGAGGESDLDLLATTANLTRTTRISRAYFSRFNPIPGTPLENTPPTPALREFRLYQSSFLLRDYGFNVEELPFLPDGYLPLHQDPKQVWAENHLTHHPVEINTATRAQLLRVPGFGPARTASILKHRQHGAIQSLQQLKAIGAYTQQALPYILVNGTSLHRQLTFW